MRSEVRADPRAAEKEGQRRELTVLVVVEVLQEIEKSVLVSAKDGLDRWRFLRVGNEDLVGDISKISCQFT